MEPQGLRANQVSRVPLDYLGLQALQGTTAPTEEGLWPDAAIQVGEGGQRKQPEGPTVYRQSLFDPDVRMSLLELTV